MAEVSVLLSIALRGNPKLIAAMTGKKMSDETKAKMSATHKARWQKIRAEWDIKLSREVGLEFTGD